MKNPISSRKVFWWGIGFGAFFTGLIWVLGYRLAAFAKLPDQGPLWYYWKLPGPEFWASLTAWGLYLGHQFSVWWVIFKAQQERLTISNWRPGSNISRWNLWLIALNMGFIVLHLIQTQVFYDGLAQFVPVWSSQGSVIIMLALILILDNQRRGLFFNWKAPFAPQAVEWVRRFHGYIISWACIYTLWYHPMESTSGHLLGFFYMFLLLLQLTLMYTQMHFKPVWTMILEAFVGLHGTIVAVMTGNGMWPMFAFGFLMMTVATQIYGIGLKKWAIWLITGVYLLAVALVYSGWFGIRTPVQIQEIIRIPVILYLLAVIIAIVLGWVTPQKRIGELKMVPGSKLRIVLPQFVMRHPYSELGWPGWTRRE